MNDMNTDKRLLKWIADIQRGDKEAFNQLLNVFESDIQKRVSTLRLPYNDKEDIAQIIRYKLYKQALTFDCDKHDSFIHCVNVIIKNAKIDYIRKVKSTKYQILKDSLSIDETKSDSVNLIECLRDGHGQDFENQMLTECSLSYLMDSNKLSPIETDILKLTAQGKTKKEISNELDVPVKHIYNAQYRLKKKLNKAEITSALFDN
ncbi:sigma-70 family RNA polymerase sigma factor [Mammaliicoccus sciuri]|uniref:sigma-70 family RNA polymerase sigma factor n=1 Tax=Mammaliicoccus sciuri TaxID=1296 RepID=UPI00066C3FF5|nr:sigma-70 family RNA polymerase sigma factor [Mammaliicoccus sciuri]MCD3220011.1 sigma-70 family RNA polymerase sigma factor [Mammaliicoccus sciuri]MCJ0910251.1 sigma-70 family RNA polymerase sigma factor [Mammaliicoccus sciuri]MCJ0922113.1 sigma-70 family RNA polymerase sigma factor [Mammaliicoccus sciuri]MCJ0925941.1 sigma-70 family RNA polymerase sigma factor [Mammaliicoccus sciuri]MDO0951329.1 sigma-70 family RNA polymerase sigma factor [Mammaliicoccus sciuri]